MLRGIRSRMTYANVVASLALFIALGGVSYAAVKLPKNSVGAVQIKKNAVTGSKVKNSSLTGADVRDKSLTAADFNGAVQGVAGPQGPVGAKGDGGAKGDAGPTGATGSTGLSNYQLLEFTGLVASTDSGERVFQAQCPVGTRILGGGFATFNNNIKVKTATLLNQSGSSYDEYVVSVTPANGLTFGGSGNSSVILRYTCASVTGP